MAAMDGTRNRTGTGLSWSVKVAFLSLLRYSCAIGWNRDPRGHQGQCKGFSEKWVQTRVPASRPGVYLARATVLP